MSPIFRVKVDHGHTQSFKKVMKRFHVEILSFQQISRKEFIVAFEEPSTTLVDARDFYPVASWTTYPISVRT